MGDHWAVARKRLEARGKLKPKAKADLPPEAAHLWSAFVDLDESRAMGMDAPEAISYAEIVARGVALDDPLEPWEVRAVRALDRIRRRGELGGVQDG